MLWLPELSVPRHALEVGNYGSGIDVYVRGFLDTVGKHIPIHAIQRMVKFQRFADIDNFIAVCISKSEVGITDFAAACVLELSRTMEHV